MKIIPFYCIAAAQLLIAACERIPAQAPAPRSLLETRRDFTTTLVRKGKDGDAPAQPPPGLFRLVHYPSPVGALAAYVSVAPADGQRRPAIIWLIGGFSNGIGEIAWEPGPPKNDQSASAFRAAGVLMMYPSLRGGNDNPGFKETLYGEVDDVLSAIDYLRKQEAVDPERIYLGGHSTGGTLALLAAECGAKVRAIFAFGPVEDVAGYGPDVLPFDTAKPRELELRAPNRWLAGIQIPTFVMEGASGRSNITSLRAMARLPHPDVVRFLPVRGADHFGTLAPINRLLAGKIMADRGAQTNIQITEAELADAVASAKSESIK